MPPTSPSLARSTQKKHDASTGWLRHVGRHERARHRREPPDRRLRELTHARETAASKRPRPLDAGAGAGVEQQRVSIESRPVSTCIRGVTGIIAPAPRVSECADGRELRPGAGRDWWARRKRQLMEVACEVVTGNASHAGSDRVAERRRAVALARHVREAEGLSIAQIADRLGCSPATVKPYFYDPTGEKARGGQGPLPGGVPRLRRVHAAAQR